MGIFYIDKARNCSKLPLTCNFFGRIMAKNKKGLPPMRQPSAHLYHIIALISSTNEVYVRQIASNNYKAFYREHWKGDCTATAHYFHLSKPPTLHLLETIKTTSNKAYGRCIAWYLFFELCGYHVSSSAVRYHLDHPRDNDLTACDILSQKNIQEILAVDLAADWYFVPAERTVKYTVSAEDHAALLAEARSHNLTLSEYCQARFDGAEIHCPDIRELLKCSHQARTAYNLAQNIADHSRINSSNSVNELIPVLQNLQKDIRALEAAILKLTKQV